MHIFNYFLINLFGQVDYLTDRKYTYAQLQAAVVKVASALTRLGYRKGDVISIHSVNIPEFSVLLLAAASAGIVVTTSNPAYTAGEDLIGCSSLTFTCTSQ